MSSWARSSATLAAAPSVSVTGFGFFPILTFCIVVLIGVPPGSQDGLRACSGRILAASRPARGRSPLLRQAYPGPGAGGTPPWMVAGWSPDGRRVPTGRIVEMTRPDTPEPGAPGLTEDAVRAALRGVVDPELRADIVELGMVTAVRIAEGGVVDVEVALTVAGCPLRTQIRNDVETHLGALAGVQAVSVSTGVMDADQRKVVMARARLLARDPAPDTDIPDTARVIAVASGKGGVGKSSVTVNLAVAMARRGLTIGVLDADIWGFSVPRLLGMQGDVEARDKKMVPLERKVGQGVLRVLSMGFLADEENAIMWRGLILNRAVRQFIEVSPV